MRAFPGDALQLRGAAIGRREFARISGSDDDDSQSPNRWTSIGPRKAVYPVATSRTSAEYVTSGRVTALALVRFLHRSMLVRHRHLHARRPARHRLRARVLRLQRSVPAGGPRVRGDLDGASARATFTSLDGTGFGALGDLPVNTLVRDDRTGDLYVGNDFAVLRRDARSGHWHMASRGMPMVEISSLAIDSNNRALYAATHGRSAWRLDLRKDRRESTDDEQGSGRK